MIQKLEAIFYPLLSRVIAGYAVAGSAVLIALGMILLPSQAPFYLPIYVLPDALAMGQKSDFPFALSTTYSLSVYLSLVCCFLTAFAKGNLQGLARIRGKHSVSFRILSDLLIVLYVGMLLTQEFLPVNARQFSHSFFSNVLRERLFAVLWVEGVFIFTYLTVLICLFDISIFIRKTVWK